MELCCIGALSYYLQYRFFCTNEFGDFGVEQWLDNSLWFDIKLLIDINGADTTKAMTNDSYGTHIKSILKRLIIICNKLLHLGRNMGAKTLDLLEEERTAIKDMGQWAQGVYDRSYGSKLPLGPIRKLAGFHASNKLYFNTRTAVMPSDELQAMTPLGKIVNKSLSGVSEAAAEAKGNTHQTAVHVLSFWKQLNIVFLQDSAALQITKHPTRGHHPMFYQMPVFDSHEFELFKDEMRMSLDNEEYPLDANLEAVLPGLNQWHAVNNKAVGELKERMEKLSETLIKKLEDVADGQSFECKASNKALGATFFQIANILILRHLPGHFTIT